MDVEESEGSTLPFHPLSRLNLQRTTTYYHRTRGLGRPVMFRCVAQGGWCAPTTEDVG